MNTSIKSAVCFALMSLVTVGCGLQDEETDTDTAGSDAGAGGSDTGTGGSDAGGNGGDAGTGGNPTTDAGAGGSNTGTGGGGSSTMPAPVASPAACELRFADHYISGSPCGEVRGTLPGMTWSSGQTITDSDSDGYLELKYASIPAGNYQMSYLDRGCPGDGVPGQQNWALYGDPEMLKAMTDDARAFIHCNWWDAATAKVKTGVTDPSCNIHIKVGPACAISGDGNMSNFE